MTKYNQCVIPELTKEQLETSLDEKELPKAIRLAILDMRVGEKASVKIAYNYIISHYEKNKLPIPEILSKEVKGEKVECEITLDKFFTIQNLMDNSEIRKKILINGNSWKYAKLSDTVVYNLTARYDGKILYEKKNAKIEIDKANLYEIEQRCVQNVKTGEIAEIIVKPIYMITKNKRLLDDFNIPNPDKSFIFDIEVIHIESEEYIFKPNKDNISKKKLIMKGFGRDSPDRESIIALNLKIIIDGNLLYDDFEYDNLKIYEKYNQWRQEIDKEYLQDKQIDDDNDYERDSQIFEKFKQEFKSVNIIDMRTYSIPIILRKVIIHMKRNEIAYIKTNFIDYIQINGTEYENLNGKIEIYIHQLEFLHRNSFSKMNLSEKFKELSEMKDLANSFFKRGKLLRACKIYQNINYRFNYGDVYGAIVDMEGAEIKAAKDEPELYGKLSDLRISTHSNLAAAKLKLGKFVSVYDITSKIINEFDAGHIKALLMKGKSCIKLNKFEEAVEVLQRLNETSPGNQEFENELKLAKDLFDAETKKKKNMFKKMIFSN